MDDKKPASEGSIKNGSVRNGLLVAIISGIVGGSGSPFLLTKFGFNPYRPDAYTRTMAEEHRRADDRRFDALEFHVKNHPDAELRAALNVLNAQLAATAARQAEIQKQLDRILDRLDAK